MKVRVFVSVAVFIVFGLLGTAGAELPRVIGFQGVLDRADGTPLPDGVYHNVAFRLYAAATGGTPQWTEAQDITVSGGRGYFSVALGSVTPFPAGVTFSDPLWLSVEVGTDAEMAPRFALSTTPAANSIVLPYTGFEGATPDMLDLGQSAAFVVRASADVGVAGLARVAGVLGVTDATDGFGSSGVFGRDNSTNGGYGIEGVSSAGVGALGQSYGGDGVQGYTSANNASGVVGADHSPMGGYGVFAYSDHGTACGAASSGGDGIEGTTAADLHHGVMGIDNSPDGGYAVYGTSLHGWSGYFQGKVHVASLDTGGSDVAENFGTTTAAIPGTVMSIDASHPGELCPATTAYDRKVAGVVSGANGVKTGIVLPDVNAAAGAEPVAMTGRVWVRCNAESGAIAPGDMLTTSDTPGEAMKVTDYPRSQGAAIGKAMTALAGSEGMVLALIGLQ